MEDKHSGRHLLPYLVGRWALGSAPDLTHGMEYKTSAWNLSRFPCPTRPACEHSRAAHGQSYLTLTCLEHRLGRCHGPERQGRGSSPVVSNAWASLGGPTAIFIALPPSALPQRTYLGTWISMQLRLQPCHRASSGANERCSAAAVDLFPCSVPGRNAGISTPYPSLPSSGCIADSPKRPSKPSLRGAISAPVAFRWNPPSCQATCQRGDPHKD